MQTVDRGPPNAADDPGVNVRHTPVTGNNETSSLGLLMCKDLKESNKDCAFIREGPGQTQKLLFEISFFFFFSSDAAMSVLWSLVLLCFFCAAHFSFVLFFC